MNARITTGRYMTKWLVCSLMAFSAAAASAQDPFHDMPGHHDSVMFSPIDYDFDLMPLRQDTGIFFNYSRLAWVYIGEKTTIGDPGRTVQSEIIFPGTALSDGVAPPSYTIQNGIQEAVPNGDFGYGSRYELGYHHRGAGWMVGVMDGPKVNSNEFFGFNQIEVPNTSPLVDAINNPDFGDGVPPVIVATGASGVGSADLSTARTGFGSVHVNFITPPGFLLGFRDYHVNGPNNEQAPTTGGPSRQLTEIDVDAEVDQGFAVVEITDGTFTSGADDIVDDLDGDGGTFFVVRFDSNGDGMIDENDDILGTGVDFEDLHLFNIAFDNVTVRNTIESHSVEIMRFHDLDNNWMFKSRQNNSLLIGYGARFFNFDDYFTWEGKGGMLGHSIVHTVAENQIVGPQIRGAWRSQHGRFGLNIDGRFVFGYNIQDINQDSNIGEDLQPGALNRSITGQPTTTSIARQDNNFSPLVEFRAEGSYQLTGALALRLGYTAMFIDNVTRGSQVVVYSLPDMGIRRGGNQEIFMSGVDVGVEAVY